MAGFDAAGTPIDTGRPSEPELPCSRKGRIIAHAVQRRSDQSDQTKVAQTECVFMITPVDKSAAALHRPSGI